MKCPTDNGELRRQIYEANIEVDRCVQCGGIWLDHRELERIQAASEIDYSAEIEQIPNLAGQAYEMALARSKPPVQCPRCEQPMERREHGSCSQVMIDVCPSCRGVWLDQGEVSALEIFFERANTNTDELRSGFVATLKTLFD